MSGAPATSPVVPGFHPDPSICRVGDDYYLANSSFEYAPGVPLSTSRDLVTWVQLGNVLDRPSQLNVQVGREGASGGIYAPTLRHHDGRFWLITTNIHDFGRGHLLVSATDPAGPWSEPVHITGAMGIDPDLAWDDDGVCHLTWSSPFEGILQATLDPATGELTSAPVKVWQGTGLAHPEGPHLVHRGGWWYLLLAEGGTHTGHAVTVARSRSPRGPFEADPANPVLSHRSTPHPVQATGHADLVEKADGSWAMVHLGIRQRGSHPQWHVNGRETFLVGIEWVDDWPVVVDDAYVATPRDTSFSESFTGALAPRWIAPGRQPGEFARTGPEGLDLDPGRTPGARESGGLLAVRAVDDAWRAEVTAPAGNLALTLRIDDDHWLAVERVGDLARVRMVVGPLDQVLGERAVAADAVLALEVRAVPGFSRNAGPDRVVAGLVTDGGFQELADVDGRYLSTEVAGGFTGRVVGVEALGGPARVTRFAYAPTAAAGTGGTAP